MDIPAGKKNIGKSVLSIFSMILIGYSFCAEANAVPFECNYLFGRLSAIQKLDEDIGFNSFIDDTRNISGGSGKLNVFEFRTGQTKHYDIPPGSLVKVSAAGDTAVLTLREENGLITLLTVDLKNGKSKVLAKDRDIKFVRRLDDNMLLRGRKLAMPSAFDPSIESFVYQTGTRKVHLLPLKGAEAKEWLLPAEIVETNLLRDGLAFVTMKGHAPLLLNLKTGEKTILRKLDLKEGSRLVHVDASKAYFTAGERKNTVLISVDLKSGAQKEIQLPGLDRDNIQFSPAGILYGKKSAEYENMIQLLDYSTGEIRELGGPTKTFYFRNVSYSKDGNIISWFSDERSEKGAASFFTSMDLKSGKKTKWELASRHSSMNSALSEDGKRLAAVVFGPEEASYVRVWDLTSGKVNDFSISDVAEIAGIKFVAGNDSLMLQKLMQSSVVLELKSWEKFIAAKSPALRAPASDLPSLARAGKLRLARDFPEMLEFFRSGKYKSDSQTAQMYLMQVLEESPNTYYGMLADFPEVLVMAKESPLDIAKLTPTVRKRWTKLAHEFLEHRIALLSASDPKSEISYWSNLAPLRSFLAELPEDVKHEAIAKIANSLAAKSIEEPPLKGIFQPKLFKFMKQEVRTWFGETPKKFTDLVLVREENTITPILLGTAPIDGDAVGSATKFGIYAKAQNVIEIPTTGEAGTLVSAQTVSWKQAGENFSAKFEVRTGKPLATLLPSEKVPDYAALWRDNKLSGLMVTGENLQSANPDLINEYKAYYRASGFRFSTPEPVADMRAWIAEEIRSGRLDYMIKEAHTDGMENDLFRMYTKGSIEKGVKQLADGKEEVMYLFHPDPEAKASALIPNQEFGDWIRAREAADQGPLVYFNTSCYGAEKACHEYQAAASKKLLVFATTESADTFTNTQDSALRQLITGFRQKKTYEEMRKMMAKDPEYKSGEANVYLLPDDKDFDEHVRQKLKRSVDTNQSVTGPDGKPYHLDQVE